MFQEQDKTAGKKLNKIEIRNLFDEKFYIMVIKSLLILGEERINTVRTSTWGYKI